MNVTLPHVTPDPTKAEPFSGVRRPLVSLRGVSKVFSNGTVALQNMSLEVAQRLGAETARLESLNHCWMAEAPDVVAPVMERFWSSLA